MSRGCPAEPTVLLIRSYRAATGFAGSAGDWLCRNLRGYWPGLHGLWLLRGNIRNRYCYRYLRGCRRGHCCQRGFFQLSCPADAAEFCCGGDYGFPTFMTECHRDHYRVVERSTYRAFYFNRKEKFDRMTEERNSNLLCRNNRGIFFYHCPDYRKIFFRTIKDHGTYQVF